MSINVGERRFWGANDSETIQNAIDFAEKNGEKKLKNVLILQVDQNGNGFFQSKKGEAKSFSVEEVVKE